MTKLNLPPFSIKTKRNENGKIIVFDEFRKKQVVLTPEEWVRQHFAHFLVNEKLYPQTLIANEIEIELYGMRKRCDTVVYNTMLQPLMIIEYKAPTVKITNGVFEQIMRYNRVLKVPFLIVSNGLQHYACRIDYENETYEFLQDIPTYEDITKAVL